MAKRRGRRPAATENVVGEGDKPSMQAQVTNTTVDCEDFSKIQNLEVELEIESLLEEETNTDSGQDSMRPRVEEEEMLSGKEGNKEKNGGRLWSDLFKKNREEDKGMKLQKVEEEGEEVVITREDVEPEVRFWQHSLIAYVISQNVPAHVMVNFLRYRWKGIVMPRVIKHEEGYFILRFENLKDMEAALSKGNLFFYSKPVIMRKWTEGIPRLEEMRSIPVWIQLPKLPLGFWGANTLSKIVSKIGEPVKTDELTAQKIKLEYARVLVNVDMEKELKESTAIKSEADGSSFYQKVIYEWKPMFCKTCKKWGHRDEKCLKGGQKQWQVKTPLEEKELEKKEDQIVIGSEKIHIPVQSNKEVVKENGKDKGKETLNEWRDINRQSSRSRGTEDEVVHKMMNFLSLVKGKDKEAPPKPPDI